MTPWQKNPKQRILEIQWGSEATNGRPQAYQSRSRAPVPGEVLSRLGAQSLGAYSLGAYSVRATDFGAGKPLTRSWRSTHSTGSLESGSLQCPG